MTLVEMQIRLLKTGGPHGRTKLVYRKKVDWFRVAYGGVRHFMFVDATTWSKNSCTSWIEVFTATCACQSAHFITLYGNLYPEQTFQNNA